MAPESVPSSADLRETLAEALFNHAELRAHSFSKWTDDSIKDWRREGFYDKADYCLAAIGGHVVPRSEHDAALSLMSGHDRTGLDHLNEMMEHAERADRAEADLAVAAGEETTGG